MTLQQAQAQLDAMLANLGISKAQYQGRSMDFPVGDARLKEIAYLENLIEGIGAQQAGTTHSRCTYAKFNRG